MFDLVVVILAVTALIGTAWTVAHQTLHCEKLTTLRDHEDVHCSQIGELQTILAQLLGEG